ncbi:hypothetical protein MUK42_28866 [Musa troglodytarum]|uniref:Uncharacterized protein n=1 Tax=Musa troglodytarum TaxID=320322 RepID=A0A9E7F8L5_9LILI|nr:hypothetical protein MUK42_28866 [Musa troglodytarum]
MPEDVWLWNRRFHGKWTQNRSSYGDAAHHAPPSTQSATHARLFSLKQSLSAINTDTHGHKSASRLGACSVCRITDGLLRFVIPKHSNIQKLSILSPQHEIL